VRFKSRRPKQILLVNPWIYDFAAYDFWIKPLGLLLLGGILRKHGYEIYLLDCLDRHHPRLRKYLGHQELKTKENGTGKYLRTEMEKPQALRHIPRRFCRYGFPPELVDEMLHEIPTPVDAILVTSMMTFWYPAVRDMVQVIRRCFPTVPVILGGVYASLCPEHARRIVEPDYLVIGAAEEKIIPLLNEITGRTDDCSCEKSAVIPYDLYPRLFSIAITSSRGCPYHCSFCASRELYPVYNHRSPGEIVQEICDWTDRKSVRHVCFYDDALLYQPEKHIKPLLRQLAACELDVQLHMPNGLQPKNIDDELADLFYKAQVRTIRLSFESARSDRQFSMSSKVSNIDLQKAVNHLLHAGYSRDEIMVYALMGLADQDFDEVRETVQYILDLGVDVSIASFSPIPGTFEWQKAIDAGWWHDDDDLLLTNCSVFPVWSRKFGYDRTCDLLMQIKECQKKFEIL
jgi:radical SAM superfamily enzyme YgiQ (UPF0313 family)